MGENPLVVLQEKEKELEEKIGRHDMMNLIRIYRTKSFKSFEILMILKKWLKISKIHIESYYLLIFTRFSYNNIID